MEWFLHLDIFPFLAVLTTLVFVHEFGHYIVARWNGVRVNEFSIGFGPELFGRNDKHGTRWKLCLIPLGGFVKMHGDTNAASAPIGEVDMPEEEKKVAFPYKKLHQRAMIVAAGPAMNFLFAIVLMAGLFAVKGEPYAPAVVSEIMADSAAAKAGLQLQDRIISIDGKEIERFSQVQRIARFNAGKTLPFVIERGGVQQQVFVTLGTSALTDGKGGSAKIGIIGIKSTAIEMRDLAPVAAVERAFTQTYEMSVDTFRSLYEIVTGQRSFKEMGGPVKIAQVSGEVAQTTLAAFLMFIAMLSVNLGLVNLLPVPALDGGHLLYYAYEAVFRKPLSPRLQEAGAVLGIGMVMLLVVAVTWNDLAHYFR
jgi:regulator of sigma E protease